MIKLSICIPTVKGREVQFKKLKAFILKQAEPFKDMVEIVSICDNKEISIGEKRNRMYKLCKGLYAWQIDDDDWIADNALELIFSHIDKDKDCITFKEKCVFDGVKIKSSCISLMFKEWRDNYAGFNYVRTPFYKTVIKTAICQKVGVRDMRYAEDHQFSLDLRSHLSTETHINEFIYIYRHSSKEQHNQKYGIR
jgi:hypothetical protein